MREAMEAFADHRSGGVAMGQVPWSCEPMIPERRLGRSTYYAEQGPDCLASTRGWTGIVQLEKCSPEASCFRNVVSKVGADSSRQLRRGYWQTQRCSLNIRQRWIVCRSVVGTKLDPFFLTHSCSMLLAALLRLQRLDDSGPQIDSRI
jgi:hypothetical protein